jgi:diguanylate cyclase (GGDEF)-like protein
MGGEEFLLAMPGTVRTQALDVCERIRQRIAQHPWAQIAPGLQVTMSLGMACCPTIDASDLARRADEALYQAKAAGRNSLVCA